MAKTSRLFKKTKLPKVKVYYTTPTYIELFKFWTDSTIEYPKKKRKKQ